MKNLEKIGLSPNESKCYLTLLKIGSSSANEISRHSGIHRVSVYDALRGLREKGLISQITKANKMLFEAANPEKLYEIIGEREAVLLESKKVVPDLIKEFSLPKEKQEIRSFKGKAGIINIFEDMLKSKTDVLDFGAEYKIKEYLKYYFPQWEKRRIKKKIKMKFIANIKIKPTKLKLSEIRYIPKEFASSVSTYIYDGKIALVMWVENPMGVIIEHEKVVESYRNYFNFMWKLAKK